MRISSLLIISLAAWGAAARADTLRVMPLGDSITAGTDDFNLTPGGYRTALYGLLDAAEYDFDFVGSQTTNPGPIPDNDHQGHGGYSINQIRAVAVAPTALYQPNIVLFVSSGGDALYGDPATAAQALNFLLFDVYNAVPESIVFVGTCPPARGAAYSAATAEYNALMPDVLAIHAALGRSVHLVDIRASLSTADLADNLHPNPSGYAKIAHSWYYAIASVIPPPRPVLFGDLNGDREVDILDVNLVSAHWGESGSVADANRDGVVDIFDVNLVSANWTAAASTPVPEPATFLLALGTAVLCACRKLAADVRSRRLHFFSAFVAGKPSFTLDAH